MNIGAHVLRNALFVAPMAGITDRPFRRIARRFGAGLAVSEMISSRPDLRHSRKTRLRLEHGGEPRPVSVQIVGADPRMLAEAARYNVDQGADIIDINMGCPAKKVCNVQAGSALLEDEALVARILEAVVAAAAVPVTLKIRTGPSPERRNAARIAHIAEQAGVQLLAIHGRTRACGFGGNAEYRTVAEAKSRVRIPVIVNGDIRSGEDAKRALSITGADGVMIGRAAQGRPWLFAEIEHFLRTGSPRPAPSIPEIGSVLLEHVETLHALYGAEQGTRVARKHIGWTVAGLPEGAELRRNVNSMTDAGSQRRALCEYFERMAANEDRTERLAA
jgi:tRNA-dihydrouridine synthase B